VRVRLSVAVHASRAAQVRVLRMRACDTEPALERVALLFEASEHLSNLIDKAGSSVPAWVQLRATLEVDCVRALLPPRDPITGYRARAGCDLRRLRLRSIDQCAHVSFCVVVWLGTVCRRGTARIAHCRSGDVDCV
jgi:hypothetical protein